MGRRQAVSVLGLGRTCVMAVVRDGGMRWDGMGRRLWCSSSGGGSSTTTTTIAEKRSSVYGLVHKRSRSSGVSNAANRKRTAAAADRTMPAADRTMPAADRTMPAADRTMPAADRTMPAADRTMPAATLHGLNPVFGNMSSISSLASCRQSWRWSSTASAAVVPSHTHPVSWKIEETRVVSTADLTPRQIVEMLDRHIVGQGTAKKAVANALRNRWRRRQVASPLREEIVPKNILMVGPTGCGKTEIARRLAKLADAPFVKVEATKFTEVGFHGRDVDQIIRDLVENAILMVRQRLRREHAEAIERAVEDRIIAALIGEHASKETAASFRRLYREGELEDREIEIDVPTSPQRLQPPGGGEGSVQEMVIRVDRLFRGGGRGDKRKMKISEARPLIEEYESERFVNNEAVTREAIHAVEQDGIVFIDEIDKIVSSTEYRYGADASSEGVQRDLLPIIEGSVVSTKHGNVNTDYILFICSGAFHQSKPSDMLAELQGRLPVRVELKGLTQDDFYRILTEPEGNMIKQQKALLATEGVQLHFTDASIKEIARVAEEINTNVDNIGARRLYTIIERIVEDISFEAPDQSNHDGEPFSIVIDKEDVLNKLSDLLQKQDLSKYVL